MANFNKKTLGTASGAVGDVVFKNRYGKTYISSRPAAFKKSMDTKSVKNRNKFQFCMKLFPALGKIYWFKQIWSNSAVPGDTFINKMIKLNYDRIDNNLDFSNILMLPVEEGFEAKLVSYSLDKKILTITLAPLGDDSGVKNNKKVSLQGVIYLTESKSEEDKPYAFASFASDDLQAEPGKELTYTFSLAGEKYAKLSGYRKYSFIANLLTKDTEGEPKNVSVNIVSSLTDITE